MDVNTYLSEPQFPHLQNGGGGGTHLDNPAWLQQG